MLPHGERVSARAVGESRCEGEATAEAEGLPDVLFEASDESDAAGLRLALAEADGQTDARAEGEGESDLRGDALAEGLAEALVGDEGVGLALPAGGDALAQAVARAVALSCAETVPLPLASAVADGEEDAELLG